MNPNINPEEHSVSVPLEDRLRQLWDAGSRDIAIAFLRRAISPEMTLAELMRTLEFDNVKSELGKIRLSDVFLISNQRQDSGSRMDPRKKNEAKTHDVKQGQRTNSRRSRPIEEMKYCLLDYLHKSENQGISSPDLGRVLHENGYETDASRTYQLLKAMQNAGYITNEGERPKLWSLTDEGITALQQQ